MIQPPVACLSNTHCQLLVRHPRLLAANASKLNRYLLSVASIGTRADNMVIAGVKIHCSLEHCVRDCVYASIDQAL